MRQPGGLKAGCKIVALYDAAALKKVILAAIEDDMAALAMKS